MQPSPVGAPQAFLAAIWRWFDRNCVDLGRQMRLSYLPPLMVYTAAGGSGLTGIVGTFFVKEYLGLSAEFLAALGFWAMLPWGLKMPIGHLVDLIWRHKAGLVYLGASLIACSILIMIGLLADRAAMEAVMPAGAWFVLSALLAPIGYVVQDVVADAMTVEAVPRVESDGKPLSPEERRSSHTTMQMLGRVAIIGGSVLVALANVVVFQGAQQMSVQEKADTYLLVYQLALVIPLVSVAGVVLASVLRRQKLRALMRSGYSGGEARAMMDARGGQRPHVNWVLLGGSLIFVVFTVGLGLMEIPYNQEIIFAGSLAIIVFLMTRLVRELDAVARNTLVGTAVLIFVFRALPGPGAGSTWWMIDELGFDQQFLSVLSLIGSFLTLVGLFLFRRFMAERSIAYVIGFLTIAGTLLALPTLGMYYGLHEWTAAHTNGVVDARFIAVIDTAIESPLGQIAMVPMLAWIANSAPDALKATYFAVMASFTNLALSLSQLGTKYVNQVYTVTRQVVDAKTGQVTVPADYSQLGDVYIAVILIGLSLPFLTMLVLRATRLRTA
jgi:NADH:ubiquinone oxidoreductase subunit 3 (subunit A)